MLIWEVLVVILQVCPMTFVKFVYFDVGGTVIRDFSGTNKWEQKEHEPEICCGNFPVEHSLVLGLVE